MTFITPTIAASADPGPLVYAELEPAMLSAGWTLEDTVVIGTRTHKVFKSAAAGNVRNLDWYLDISYPTTGIASHLLICPFEGYDAATDLGFRGPYSTSATTYDATTYSRYGATGHALETNWVNVGTATAIDSPLTTTSFGLWVSITPNRVIIMNSNEPLQVSYSGFFTPNAAHAAHAGSALFPLIMVRLAIAADRNTDTTMSQVEAAVTRIPKVTGTLNWAQSIVVSTNELAMGGRVGSATPSPVTGQTAVVAPYTVGFNGLFWTSSYLTMPVGELEGVYCGYADASVVRGDTVTIGGVPHVTTNISSTQITLFAAV